MKKPRVKKTTEQAKSLVIQEINITSVDRSRKDIGELKTALQSAESVHYPNRTRLYDLYEDVVLDGQVTGVIEKRIESVLNKKLTFNKKGGKRVDEMDHTIRSREFRKIIRTIMETQAWGTSGMEFIPGPELSFVCIPRKHIKPHKQVIALEQTGEDGISYAGVSNLWVLGEPDDLGYLLKCGLYATYKRGALGDYAQYVEIFGQPVRIIYYDAYDTKTKMELRQVLDESGSSLALMIPKQAQFEIKDGKQTNANGDLQKKFLSYCDDQISIIVLGNTETTQASSSSGYAQSKEHGKQQLEKTKSDMEYVLNALNSDHFLSILKSYGLPVDGGMFEFEKEIDLDELKKKAEIEEIVMRTFKVPIDDDYVYRTYGIEKPDNYDELKAKQEEEKLAMQQNLAKPGNPPEEKPDDKPKPAKPKPESKDLVAPTFWDKFRSQLADFFDPAP